MDIADNTLNVIMIVSTITLVIYGLSKGYDKIELTLHNTYFAALILYLIKNNFLKNK